MKPAAVLYFTYKLYHRTIKYYYVNLLIANLMLMH